MRILIILLFATAVAHAQTAREHYERGAALYDATRYESALREFEEAYTKEESPALVYNIARCLDRLGRVAEAAAAYERFLVQAPDAVTAASARQRLDAIKLLSQPVPVRVRIVAPAPPRRRYLGPGLLGGGTLVLGVIGAGLLGSALVSYNDLSTACAPNCSSSTWAGLPAREHAGEALLGVAGAVAVADVVWFVIERRRRQ